MAGVTETATARKRVKVSDSLSGPYVPDLFSQVQYEIYLQFGLVPAAASNRPRFIFNLNAYNGL